MHPLIYAGITRFKSLYFDTSLNVSPLFSSLGEIDSLVFSAGAPFQDRTVFIAPLLVLLKCEMWHYLPHPVDRLMLCSLLLVCVRHDCALILPVIYEQNLPYYSEKDKAVPLQAWSGPEGSRKLRFSDFMITALEGGKVVGITHRPLLPSGNSPGTHFR